MTKRLLRLAFFLLLAACGTLALRAQNDTSALHPPKGAKVAIVIFEDLQCPDCARAEPLIEEASKAYGIPIVRYDFPLPMHNWSMDATIMAHYFGSKSEKLGVDFRSYIFQNQPLITPQNLRSYAEKFAKEHNTDLPFVLDPQGKFAAEIRASKDLGNRMGLQHTPTLWVVSSATKGRPFVEVVDRRELFNLIDDMRRQN